MNDGDKNIIEIQILHTSDLHGRFTSYDYTLDKATHLGGLASIATKVEELRKQYPNTYLLDTGDTFQGNYNELFRQNISENPLIRMFNALEYDAFTLGNHEFNFGISYVYDIMNALNIPTLAANLYDDKGKRLTKPYLLFNKGGVRVAVVGMVTANILRWDADHLDGVTVHSPLDEMKTIWSELEGKADLYVLANHQPWHDQYAYGDGYEQIIKHYPAFQVILVSHSHQLRSVVENNQRAMLQPGSYGSHLGQIVARFHKHADGLTLISLQTTLIPMANVIDAPKYVAMGVEAHDLIIEKIRQPVGRLVGGSLVPPSELLNLSRAQVECTPLIALINDIQRFYTKADISMATLFHIDSNLFEGEINRADISNIYRHNNALRLYKMRGWHLKKIMEWSARYFNQWKEGDLTISFSADIPVYEYAQLGGVLYDINISKPEGSRIENLRWPNGNEVDDEEEITVVMDDFRAKGYIERDLFAGDTSVELLMDYSHGNAEDGQIREYLISYIQNQELGIISNIINEKENHFRIMGYSWDHDARTQMIKAINAQKVEIPKSENGLSFYVRALRVENLPKD